MSDEPATNAAEPSTPENEEPSRRRRHVVEWVILLVVAVSLSFLFRAFVFETYFVPSGSMEPTLWPGDRIVVDKLSVDFGTINVGDIVVFKAPPNVLKLCGDPVADLVKRVIGLPGDHLTSRGNTIYVNGHALDQKWSHYTTLGAAIGHVVVPANHYFMMGDNHQGSCDSRVWGTVPRSSIIGKVFVRMWPLSKIRWY